MTLSSVLQRLVAFALVLFPAASLHAQSGSDHEITLTIEEAIQIALVQNYAIQATGLDLAEGNTQLREAYGVAFPSLSLNSGYTRNLVTANPFAGSDAGALFNGFGFLGWLAYNEDARTDDDPSTDVLTYDDYNDRIEMGMRDAGLEMDSGGNPFSVANQFQSSVTLSQTLFDLSALTQIDAARELKNSLELMLSREEQLLVNRVRQAFYQVLLFENRTFIASLSVQRTRKTLDEATRLVARGISPKEDRLGSEVQLALDESVFLSAQNAERNAKDNLKLLLGIPITQPLRLVGELEADLSSPYLTISVESAIERARSLRPDLQQLESLRRIASIRLRGSKRSRFPTIEAVANFNFIGSVPSDRTFGRANEDDPFLFTRGSNSFFDDSYWNPALSVGVTIRWNLFDGFSRRARIQRFAVDLDRAELSVLRGEQTILLEVTIALRNLKTARAQLLSQQKIVTTAEISYHHNRRRWDEGIGTLLDERLSSTQLDNARNSYLQTVYDFLVAQSTFETATGIPLIEQSDFRLTQNSPQ